MDVVFGHRIRLVEPLPSRVLRRRYPSVVTVTAAPARAVTVAWPAASVETVTDPAVTTAPAIGLAESPAVTATRIGAGTDEEGPVELPPPPPQLTANSPLERWCPYLPWSCGTVTVAVDVEVFPAQSVAA